MKNTVKLLRIISTLDPKYGGPAGAIIDNSLYLKSKGIRVDIVTNDCENSNFYKDNKLRVINVGSKYFPKSFNPFLFFWILKNRYKYNNFVVHGIWELNTLIAKLLLKKNYYVFAHGQLDPYFKNEKIKILKKKIYWFLIEKKNLINSKSLLLTSPNEKKLLNKTYVNTEGIKKTVVEYGIKESKFDKKKIEKKFFQKFKFLKNKKFFLFLGRFHKKKGCEILLNSMEKILRDNKNIYLLMAGPTNNYKSNLINLSKKLKINKNIVWSNFLKNELKWSSIDKCEAMVLSSHGENFGISIIESLSMSRPVLITNKVNTASYIKKTNSGFVSNNNVNSFYKILNNFLKLNDKSKKQMHENAFNCYLRYFNLINSNNKFVTLLKKKI
jgi:glycosyltransferase involved in cell wall biosynthesis